MPVSSKWSSDLKDIPLDRLLERLERAFGEELSFAGRDLAAEEVAALQRVFADEGYQVYLQDQVNRQIIRDYLINAVMLGYIPEQELERIAPWMTSAEGRATLSLHMLMSAVEQAGELVAGAAPEPLRRLKADSERAPHLKLIDN
jgi:hypothetical protein